MESTEEKYPELYKDNHLGPLLRGLKDVLIGCDKELRLEFAKGMLKLEKDAYEEKISNAIKIIHIVGKNNLFAADFGIDINKLKKELGATVRKYKKEIKNRRANPHYLIFIYHRFIFHNLQYLGWGQTQQVNFMFDIYMECDFQGYKARINAIPTEFMKNRISNSLKGSIRKSQEKALKQPHSIDYGI